MLISVLTCRLRLTLPLEGRVAQLGSLSLAKLGRGCRSLHLGAGVFLKPQYPLPSAAKVLADLSSACPPLKGEGDRIWLFASSASPPPPILPHQGGGADLCLGQFLVKITGSTPSPLWGGMGWGDESHSAQLICDRPPSRGRVERGGFVFCFLQRHHPACPCGPCLPNLDCPDKPGNDGGERVSIKTPKTTMRPM